VFRIPFGTKNRGSFIVLNNATMRWFPTSVPHVRFFQRFNPTPSYCFQPHQRSTLRLSTSPADRMEASTKMIQANRLKQAFMKGTPSIGLWQMLPGANISRALARTPGVDWVMVDCEHGEMNGWLCRYSAVLADIWTDPCLDAAMHQAVPAINSCGVSACVRMPDFQGWMIKRKTSDVGIVDMEH